MKSPSAREGDQPSTHGPANVWAYSPCDIRRVGPAFGGQSVPGPFPFETLGSVWPAIEVGPGPKVPTQYIYRNSVVCFQEQKSFVLKTVFRSHLA